MLLFYFIFQCNYSMLFSEVIIPCLFFLAQVGDGRSKEGAGAAHQGALPETAGTQARRHQK